MSVTRLTLVSAMAFAAAAFVAPHAVYAASSSMKMLDTDSDGTVDLPEVMAAATKKWSTMDPDKDGTVDMKEANGIMSKSMFKKADPDKDGTIDEKEYTAAVEAAFKKADPDGDGKLDAKELKSPAGKHLLKIIE